MTILGNAENAGKGQQRGKLVAGGLYCWTAQAKAATD